MVTIRDVAKLAGVSSATVSRVLNNNYAVSDERREKVMRAVEELGYRPNIIGRNLSRNENRTILVVSSHIDSHMMRGAYYAATALGYDLILSFAPDGYTEDALKYYENGLAGGIILINFNESDEQIVNICKKYPVVQCAEYIDFPGSCHVSIDDTQATCQMTEMLIKRGRKRLAFMAPGNSRQGITVGYAEQREKGFREALRRHNIVPNPDFIARLHPNSYEAGAKQMRSWLTLPPEERPDAVVCAQDLLGAACVSVITHAGIDVPRQIAVTGYDNLMYSGMCIPKLTTVAQPFYEMGAESVRMLVKRMAGAENFERTVYLHHDIILRGSTEEGLE